MVLNKQVYFSFLLYFIDFRKKQLNPKVLQLKKQETHLYQLPDSSFSNSPNPTGMEEEHQGKSNMFGVLTVLVSTSQCKKETSETF